MSSCAASDRALTTTGSSSEILDRSWAIALSLACISLHKCLWSLAASDSSDEQVDVLSPRWLRRMVVVDCRLVLEQKEKKQGQNLNTLLPIFYFDVYSITYLGVLLLRQVQLLRATLGFIWTLSESRSRSLINSEENSPSPRSSPWPESRHSNSSLSLWKKMKKMQQHFLFLSGSNNVSLSVSRLLFWTNSVLQLEFRNGQARLKNLGRKRKEKYRWYCFRSSS